MPGGKNTNNTQKELQNTIKELKQLFKKITYPTDKQELINHAQLGSDGDAPVFIVDSLPQDEFEHFSDLAEALDAYRDEKIKELSK